MNKKETITLLKKYGIRAQKSLGQNFIIDDEAIAKVIDSADIDRNDQIIEIGPGIGNITKLLCEKAKKVVAIEKDSQMVRILKDQLGSLNNLEIINDDIFAVNLAEHTDSGYKIVANIPYYITGHLFRYLFETQSVKPSLITLFVQKEVGEKIISGPPDANMLSVSVHFYGLPKIIYEIGRDSFFPVPDIDSVIIKIIVGRPKELQDVTDEKLFFRIVKAGFSGKRKKLRNSLSAGLEINQLAAEELISFCGIDPEKRAENLSMEDWKCLYSKTERGPNDG